MSEKRRDHRGRILHNGEIQLSDGRYRFKYVDEMGKERCVYSWRLDHNDATPKGKRRTLSLREMEKKIQADHFEQIATNGGNMTVLELVEKYTSTKTGVRPTTVGLVVLKLMVGSLIGIGVLAWRLLAVAGILLKNGISGIIWIIKRLKEMVIKNERKATGKIVL